MEKLFKNETGSHINLKIVKLKAFYYVALLLCFHHSNAQVDQHYKTMIGVALGSSISGNGHGSIYLPQLVFTNKRSAFLLGACLQKQALRFNGAKLAYEFVLNARTKKVIEEEAEDSTDMVYQYFKSNDPREDVNLDPNHGPNIEQRVNFKLYVYAEYLKNNLLSHCTQKMEAHVNRVEGYDWKTATLSTVEGGLGFELGVRLAKNVQWNTFIAASFYYHTKYINNMHHEQFSPCITLGTSISIPKIKGFN